MQASPVRIVRREESSGRGMPEPISAENSIDVSLIVPAYNERENVRPFYDATCKTFAGTGISYQIVFVDDGSSDGTLAELKAIVELPDKPCHITVVPFSRNFGKEAALYAGMQHARGAAVGFIDADLQQRPETFLEMYRTLMADPDCDCVAAYQEERKSNGLRNFLSRQFYKVLSNSSHMDVVANASDFRVFTREVASALLSLGEYHRFTKGLFAWVGFNTKPFAYTPDERNAGTTSWSLKSLFKYAFGGLISFTTAPLQLAMYLGGIASLAAIIYLVVNIVKRLAFGVDVPGYATIVVLLLFFGGLQLLILGIIGEYLARTYVQGKHRPIYISRTPLESAAAQTSGWQKGNDLAPVDDDDHDGPLSAELPGAAPAAANSNDA